MPSYLTTTDADAIADALPGLASFKAAEDAAKAAALELATDRFDTARRYQGRKFDPTQTLEFPRVAYSSGLVGSNAVAAVYDPSASTVPDTIWDWDRATNAAIVPLRVQRAVVHEADSILRGDRDGRRQAQIDGLASQAIGSANETYFAPTTTGGVPVLCMEAERVSRTYALRSGSMR